MLKEKIKSVWIKINALSHEVSEEQFKTLKAISSELKDCYEIAKEWEENVLIAPRKKEQFKNLLNALNKIDYKRAAKEMLGM